MTGISEETWARLRAQVEACQGESIARAEQRRRREFREAAEAIGWDGRTCRADPCLVERADPAQVRRIEQLWFGLVRQEYALSGDLLLKAYRGLSWAFHKGSAPWDVQVTRLLAKHNDAPVWTRAGAKHGARALRAFFAEAGQA